MIKLYVWLMTFHAFYAYSLKDESILATSQTRKNLIRHCIYDCLGLANKATNNKSCKYNSRTGIAPSSKNCTSEFKPLIKNKVLTCNAFDGLLLNPQAALCDYVFFGAPILFNKATSDVTVIEKSVPDLQANIDRAKAMGISCAMGFGEYMSSTGIVGDTLDKISQNANLTKKFVSQLRGIVDRFKLDGMMIMWMLPSCPAGVCGMQSAKDKNNARGKLVAFFNELNNSMEGKKVFIYLMLHMPSAYSYLGNYFSEIIKWVDYIIIETHELREPNGFTHSPRKLIEWINGFAQFVNNDYQVLRRLIFTLASSSASYNVKDPKKEISKSNGRASITYDEICQKYKNNKNWVVEYDSTAMQYVGYDGKTWVSFDEYTSIQTKVDYLFDIGGAGLHAYVNYGDYNTNCGCEKLHYLRVLSEMLKGGECSINLCKWY
ncbi:probable chitinase 10 [Cloeon dipterum]|uniref:probable chitinase 10 n=1 Tax=Cloeon dipterum TaxID=197152 RepID=UPI0032206B0B